MVQVEARRRAPQNTRRVKNNYLTTSTLLNAPAVARGWRNSDDRSVYLLLLGLGGLLFTVANVVLSTRLHRQQQYEERRLALLRRGGQGVIPNGTVPTSASDRSTVPPIYWVNSELSPVTRNAPLGTSASFASEERNLRDATHQQRVDSDEGSAGLLAHRTAVERARAAGHDLVLVLEADAAPSRAFLDGWRDRVARAPEGWRVLHFAAEDPRVRRHLALLREPFVSWQPCHGPPRAYAINGDGMRTLLDPEGARFSASDVVYSLVGEAYTCTDLWVESSSGLHVPAAAPLPPQLGGVQDPLAADMPNAVFEESLLVLTTVGISSVEDMERDLRWIRQDSRAVCRFHRKCDWEVQVAISDPALAEIFRQSSSGFPPNVHFDVTASSNRGDASSFARQVVARHRMTNYDLVLLKDSHLHIVGFPWRSFVERKENAVVASPLRQAARAATVDAADGTRTRAATYALHEARHWLATDWSAELYARLAPTEVPILEPYFTLLDAGFADFFFGPSPPPDSTERRRAASSPELLWCQAAKEWNSGRPCCYLIPVVVSGTAPQAGENDAHNMASLNNGTAFNHDPQIGEWMRVSTEWHNIIHGQGLPQIEQRCRSLLGIDPTDAFDLQTCAMKLIFSYVHYRYVPTLHKPPRSSPAIGNSGNTTGSWASCSSSRKALESEQRPRTSWERHRDSAHAIVSCIRIHYRLPHRSLHRIKFSEHTTAIGVLSGAAGAGPSRRRSIRATWAAGATNVLFVVAGPWSHVAEEYDQHQDLLWLDMDEIYLTEISHLTFKTMAFLTVLYERAMATSEFLQYLFKTDDDSYVAIKKLHHVLFTQDRGAAGPDYWGKCRTGAKPHRNQVVPWQKKWFIPYEVYPEAEYPPYCQGAGYAVSKKFLACAIGERHAAVARYQPNEDVAVGMLAERCHIKCTSDDRVWIRYDAARDGKTMDRRVVQHYVQSEEEMRAFHDSVTVALY